MRELIPSASGVEVRLSTHQCSSVVINCRKQAISRFDPLVMEC